MQTSQNRTLQIILTAVGIIASISRNILKYKNIQIFENQNNIIQFIAFGCLSGASYLNYKQSISEGKTNSNFFLGLSIFLGIVALASLSNLFY